MKLIDKFLKLLKTDRNTFATYVLTLLAFYLCIDRVVEVIFIGLTGMGVSYWGPIKYTLAMAVPIFAFYFSFASKFVTEDNVKLSFLYIYTVALYIMFTSMIIQWVNRLGWFILFSVPNYAYIITNFMDLIKPAFSCFAWYLPIISFYPLFKWCYTKVQDTKDLRDSVFDYNGIDLSGPNPDLGPYTCEMFLCKDKESGKIIKTPEARRFEATLIVGVSGSGKTSMMFEPMIARDIEKKYFFRETSKEMGYAALKTGIASLNVPYDNDYLNANFNLNMLVPVASRDKIFKAYFNKLLYYSDSSKNIYKNLGITYVAPDYESVAHMKDVAENFGMKYNIIDPNDNTSVGLNPFIYDDPIKTSIAISSVLRRMYAAERENEGTLTIDDTATNNIVTQAIENLTLLLKEMYPRLNNGNLPNLADLLMLLNDFDKIEALAEEMNKVPELVEKYPIQLSYFKKNFYRSVSQTKREDMEKFLQASTSQLENLLRYPGVANIICNRTNNINFDKALEQGELTFVCTRRGDLGAAVQRAFGIFFLLLMQQSVLSRPGVEKSRIPHFLYIDEFPPFICSATADIFTLYRKYRVGTIISSQNLSQFGTKNGKTYREQLLANCTTKIVFGNNAPEDNEWWEKELGTKRQWTFQNDYKTGEVNYDQTYKNIKWAWIPNYTAGKVQSLKFKAIIYKTKDLKGASLVGSAKIDFLESRYKEKQKVKTFNFTKFTNGIIGSNPEEEEKKSDKFDLKHINFGGTPENPNNMDPIQFNNSDLPYEFEEENAITKYNYKNKNNNNETESDNN